MSIEKAKEKMQKHNDLVRELEEDGFFCCEGRVFTGDSFNKDTATWVTRHKPPVADLCWNGREWRVEPRDGCNYLFEDKIGEAPGFLGAL